MQVSDLRQGDVLLFETEPGVTIDDLIVLLTGSNITHAALYYKVPGVLADAYPPTIALHAISDVTAGRNVYVRHLGDGTLPMQSVTDAADVYICAEEPYDMPGLVMLGLLLLYKHANPISSFTQEIAFQILKRVASRLDRLFAKGKQPMVCSEFVYQCFADAAAKDGRYALTIKNGDLQMAKVTRPSLLGKVASLVAKHPHKASIKATAAESAKETAKSDDELVATLLDALRKDAESLKNDAPLHDHLVEVIQEIADLFYKHAPKELASGAPNALAFLQRQSSFFVTPGDLQSHCPSLTDQGVIKLQREDADWHPG
jgi:hypothetical protein